MTASMPWKPGLTLAFSSKDRAKAADWYARHLGFSVMYDAADIGWCEMATHIEGVTVGFADTADTASNNCVPVFETSDIDAARTQLESMGVRFDGPTQVNEGMVKLATFFDGDGNALMLSQSLMEM